MQWTTHRPEGLTVKDVEMAAFCDMQGMIHAEMGKDEAEPTITFELTE